MTRPVLLGSCGLALMVAAVALTFGAGGTWHWGQDDARLDSRLIWEVRAPRLALGFLAGAALAIAGMAFQAVFRNALATPYTLGVSAGASLGAAVYVFAGVSMSAAGVHGHVAAALVGAALAFALVFGLGRAAGGFAPSTLLLAGVAVSFLCTSAILALQYVGDVSTSFRIGRWLLGGLETVGFGTVLRLAPLVVVGVAGILAVTRDLDLLVMGDASAASRGVAIAAVHRIVFSAASLMVAGVVATCGPIGFVGLVVPHVGRAIVGSRHQALAPFCVIVGGIFLVLCDTVGRTILAPIEIPVSIITAFVGTPFFLALLVRHSARHPARHPAGR